MMLLGLIRDGNKFIVASISLFCHLFYPCGQLFDLFAGFVGRSDIIHLFDLRREFFDLIDDLALFLDSHDRRLKSPVQCFDLLLQLCHLLLVLPHIPVDVDQIEHLDPGLLYLVVQQLSLLL